MLRIWTATAMASRVSLTVGTEPPLSFRGEERDLAACRLVAAERGSAVRFVLRGLRANSPLSNFA
jgi:hypothetical protein